jgi:hypothetical protein
MAQALAARVILDDEVRIRSATLGLGASGDFESDAFMSVWNYLFHATKNRFFLRCTNCWHETDTKTVQPLKTPILLGFQPVKAGV